MDEPYEPCRSCGEVIPTTSRSCPVCSYDLARHNRLRLVLGGVGTVLTLTIVLAPIGIPLLLAAERHRRLAVGTATSDDAKPIGAHLRAVLHQQLSLTRTIERNGEFTRASGDSGRTFDQPPRL